MDGKARIGSIVSIPLAVLLVIFFFLPWVKLSCGGRDVGQANGWELTVGDMSPVEGAPAQDEGDRESNIKARPWFILGLIVPILALAVGALGATGRKKVGAPLIVLGLVGVLVMILAANVDYADELQDQMQVPQPPSAPPTGDQPAPPGMDAAAEQMGRQMAEQGLKTEATGIVWVSLVLYVLVVLCGVANLMLPKVSVPTAAPAQPAPPPPAAPPSPPQQAPPPPQQAPPTT